jgi:hypothetical protein
MNITTNMNLTAKVAMKAGPCDSGEREYIRRRLCTATIPGLARDLGRTEMSVADALRFIAGRAFAGESGSDLSVPHFKPETE